MFALLFVAVLFAILAVRYLLSGHSRELPQALPLAIARIEERREWQRATWRRL